MIAVRAPPVFRTAVPEATIDKNGEARMPEDEIRTTGQWFVAPPADNSERTEDFGELQLRVPIAFRADHGHHRRALRLVEYVSHSGMRDSAVAQFGKALSQGRKARAFGRKAEIHHACRKFVESVRAMLERVPGPVN